jgi:hypothetical protein
MHQLSKAKITIFSLLLFSCFFIPVYGVTGDEATISQLLDTIFRILNILILISGLVFAIMLGVASVKFSLSLGDPKGYEGAKATLTSALFGFGIVLGVFVIFNLIGSTLGIRGGWSIGTNAVQTYLESKIGLFLALIGRQ